MVRPWGARTKHLTATPNDADATVATTVAKAHEPPERADNFHIENQVFIAPCASRGHDALGSEKWSPKFGQGCKVVFALMRGPYDDGKATQFFT